MALRILGALFWFFGGAFLDAVGSVLGGLETDLGSFVGYLRKVSGASGEFAGEVFSSFGEEARTYEKSDKTY